MTSIMKWKNLAVVGLSLALAASMSSCGRGDSDGDNGDRPKQYVAMSFANGDVQTWNEQLDMMKEAIEDAGYGFLSDNPQNNAEKQASDWQAWIQRGDVKAIMGFPVQADALVPVTKQAVDAGIDVISYASSWEGSLPGLSVDDFSVGKDVGVDAGTFINDSLGGEATVAVLSDRSSDLGIKRADGMLEGLEETAPDAKVKEIGIQLARQSAYDAAAAQISADPDTKVWITLSDDPALGIYQALLDSGVAKDDPEYFVGSVDGQQEALSKVAVPQSIYRAAYIVTSQTCADINVRAFMASLEGKPVEPENVEFTKVTPDNVDEFLE